MLWGALGLLLQVATPPREPQVPRAAREAQARFERVRRAWLPRERAAGSGPCTVRVGRFCYWYDSTEVEPEREPAKIGEARAQLLAALEQAAQAAPTNGWVAGQRVAYLVEAGRFREAIAVATACGAERWWCSSLAGYALHSDQQYRAADSAYAQALAAMPAEQRCDWYDLRRMVAPPLAREFATASCEERARAANALWESSVPLFSVPGNDLRTEHFARLTLALIRARAANAYGMGWSGDTRELLLRYGGAQWYSRRDPRIGAMLDDGGIVGHDREPSYAFFPAIRSTRGVPWIEQGDWRLRAPDAESRYAPRHVGRLVPLRHQLMRSPRGDSTLLTVTVAIDDTALANDSVTLWLGALDRRHRRLLASGSRTVSLTVPNDSLLVSIEAVGARSRRAARARYTIEPVTCQRGLCVSDMLLTRGADRPATLEAALRLALPGATARASEPLGVVWEVRASGSRESVRMTLSIEPLDVSAPRRLAARFGIGRLPAPVRLQWMAMTESTRLESTILRLPPGARGRHRIVLRVERGAQSAVTERVVDITP